MNAQQAPRFRTARRILGAATLILLPFAVLGHSTIPAHAAHVAQSATAADAAGPVVITIGSGGKWICFEVWPFGERCYEWDL